MSPDGKSESNDIPRNQIKSYETPVIYNTSMFFVRNRAARQWQIELRNIIEAIEDGFPIPDSIKSLITEIEGDILNHFDNVEDQKSWQNIGEEILFPLEANNEQKEIVKRLASNFGVVVQGPPGTGKSHTIANLICHLLSHGKRVLVTSHTERALKVLADKIPTEIRHLCVNVAGGDTQSLKDVEESIRMLSENISSMDVHQLRKDIEVSKKELGKVRDNVAKLRYQLKLAALKEHKSISFEDKELRPLDIANWVKENEKHNWIPDAILWEADPPSEEKMIRLFSLAGNLHANDLESLSFSRPSIEELPSPTEFSRIITSWIEEEKKFNKSKIAIDGWQNINDVSVDIAILIDQVKKIIADLQQFDQPWLQKILEDIAKGGLQRANWESLINDSHVAIEKIVELNRELAQYNIELPIDKHYSELKEDVVAIKQYLSSNKKIGWMFINVTGRRYNYLFQKCKINNCAIRDEKDMNILLSYIEKLTTTELMVNKWNSFIKDVEGELIEKNQPRLLATLDGFLNIIQTALNWGKSTNLIIEAVNKFGVKGVQNWTDRECIKFCVNG